ncbi:ABC transporter substrate-binding protein [Bacillus cereus group sp. MYBK108-2]|uniref:ABC transporter substrate-binding protein n=1 Tax=unclassified Bacillus cereus group TaxID=2750818 RepID=UPI0028905906|nr:ABC transporter substrate-binding protein [Bacillus cereus]MDA2307623.1 ABC transporter substrate-binding protein [Bacillus cereus]HDX9634244.1 SgrR family transcriptional regulator [Bacillus cereus]HEF1897130.1 SgrR family transcriptional regulator [Bacillus cereus]
MKDYTYFQMRAFLFNQENNQSVQFKLSELTELWQCSQKQAKRHLKKFIEEEKIHYEPGRGRGNFSKIIFHYPFQEEVEKKVLKLVETDKLEEIITLLQLQIPQIWISNVSQEVRSLFGIHTSEQSKDILRTIITRKLTTLDPLHTVINFETNLIHQLGDSLLTYNPKEDKLYPHIAHHWEEAKQGKIWTFYLRKGIRFHNGHLLTSEDVKYTFRRFLTHYTPHSWLVEDIEFIECPSPFTIKFILKQKNLFFPRYLASQNLAILSNNTTFNENVWIGTGAFQLKKRTNNTLVLKAFDNYFLSRPLLDEIEIYSVPVAATSPITYNIKREEEDIAPFQSEDIEVGFQFLAFNFNRNNIVHNQSFRKAIFELMDLHKMWDDLNRSNLQEATSYFHWKSSPNKKNSKQIKQLLKQAGYSGEILTVYTLDKKSYIEEAEWLKTESAKYNLQFIIKTYTLEEYYLPFFEEADLLFMGEVASVDHHLSFMEAFLNKSLILNRFFTAFYLNKITYYLDKIKQTMDWRTREFWIEQAEDYIKKENLFLYLYHPIKTKTFHPMIKDIQFESFGYVDFKKVWIK